MMNSFELDFCNDNTNPRATHPKTDTLKMLGASIGKSDLKGELSLIATDKCKHYQNHVFSIGNLESLCDDIKANGVMNPIIVRPSYDGKYEVLSGHRRLEASKMAGLAEIEAIIIEATDDEADQIMVNANLLQRQNFTKGELARAYKIRARQFLHQGKQEGEQTYKLFAQEMGKSESYAKRILYLSRLSDELLILMDQKMIGTTAAESLRHLTEKQMDELADLIKNSKHRLTTEEVQLISAINRSESVKDVWDSFPKPKIARHKYKHISFNIEPYLTFFPDNMTLEEICKTISDILDKHFNDNEL